MWPLEATIRIVEAIGRLLECLFARLWLPKPYFSICIVFVFVFVFVFAELLEIDAAAEVAEASGLLDAFAPSLSPSHDGGAEEDDGRAGSLQVCLEERREGGVRYFVCSGAQYLLCCISTL